MASIPNSRRQQILRYLLPVLTTAAAVVITQAVQPFVSQSVTPPFILAVAVAALYGGRGPGAVAAVLGALALGWWFFPPADTQAYGNLGRHLIFLAVALVVTFIAGKVHEQRRRALREAGEQDRLRRMAEGAAAEARQAHEAVARLAAIVTSSSDAIVGKTLDGTVTSWNAAAERIFGYSAAEMVGGSIFRLIPPEHHDAERDLLQRIRGGESVEFAEAERIRSDGQRIWISLSVSPVRDRDGTIIGAASIKRDVTERRILEERLRDTQRLQAVGQLAGGIAHEANNQMSVVLGGAHFLLRRTDLPAAARTDVEQIRLAAERTASITQQLLAFSRRQMLQLKQVSLNEVVQTIGPVLRRTLNEDQELVARLGLLERSLRADPRQLEQVLLNLTLNARDAMPEGGRLTLETSEIDLAPFRAEREGLPPGSYQVLTMRDNGLGMDQTTLDHIFEPFFTTKDVGRGTGLGLSVVHGIVSQTGGHIRVESGVGEGTTFRLYFPIALPGPASGTSASGEVSAPKRGTTALVVEDDALVRAMATRALAAAGYEVVEAPNGAAALEAARGRRFDVVVTDIGMPVMDGHGLARCLEQERPELPVIFMTGYGERVEDVAQLPESRRVLLKPFSPDLLVELVGEVLTKRG